MSTYLLRETRRHRNSGTSVMITTDAITANGHRGKETKDRPDIYTRTQRCARTDTNKERHGEESLEHGKTGKADGRVIRNTRLWVIGTEGRSVRSGRRWKESQYKGRV